MEKIGPFKTIKNFTDKRLQSAKKLFKMVLEENIRQLLKWGVQSHSSFEWMNYLTEEVGELAKAIAEYEYRNGTKLDVMREAVQVATLSLKILEMFDEEDDGQNIRTDDIIQGLHRREEDQR